MLRTLRRQLVLSHILPPLCIIPMLGLALVYVLETQVVLPSLAQELQEQARLVVALADDQPSIWSDPVRSQALVARVDPGLTARVMLLTPDGRLLASSDRADSAHLGQRLDLHSLLGGLGRETSVHVAYSQQPSAEIVDVLAPVLGPDQHIVGIVRLTHQMASVSVQFLRLRYLITGVLAIGLLLGAAAGWALALNLARPLRQVTQAIHGLAGGHQLTPLSEAGPEEVGLLARAFNALVGRITDLEHARRQLLSNLVHELGQQLGAVRSAVQALVGSADTDAALRHELLVGIDGGIGRLQRLLDDLTRLHDRVMGSLELARRPVLLSAWLAPALIPWREAAQAKGLRWETDIPPDLPTLAIDPDRVAQALGNLVSNAVKYTPPGELVAVSAGIARNAVWIAVRDAGGGIALEEQERIFVPFYRGRTTQRFPEGMGLGLTIARDLIVAHGGQLTIDSAPGQGSRFTINL
ncbi:MAG TPA: HAMP domain-containing sensor histidine kinase, partial [Roseiflexaceae bacterium]|nr:HAMP domain-containing sensor histidine kinase [Roseiflexaceae bacterium]